MLISYVDTFILMLPPQGHKMAAGRDQGYILSYSSHKKGRFVFLEKAMWYGQPQIICLPQT